MKRISLAEWWQIPDYNNPDQASPGRVEVDTEKCTGCGICAKACPANALVVEDKLVRMQPAGINECMGCGDCMPVCPTGAMALVKGNEFIAYYKTIDRGELAGPRLAW